MYKISDGEGEKFIETSTNTHWIGPVVLKIALKIVNSWENSNFKTYTKAAATKQSVEKALVKITTI